MASLNEETMKILLVEDSEFDRRQILRALQEQRILNPVMHFDNAEDAWELLQREGSQIGLVLLDLNLPVMSGHDLLDHIRGHQELSSMFVIILTTSDRDEDILRSYGNDANAYIQKPFDVDSFMYHFLQQPTAGIRLGHTVEA